MQYETKPARALRHGVAILLAATLAACGGNNQDDGASVPPPTGQDGEKAGLRLLAGDPGGTGILDGRGRAARLAIGSAAADNDGNLLTAESLAIAGGPSALRMVSPAGVVTTLLATPAGVVDGNKATARLGRPVCPAPGPGGSVYFVEGAALDTPGDSRAVPIRKLAADGSVSTVATIAVAPGDTLCLSSDNSGKLYAYQQERISSVSASGSVSTLAGAVTGAGGVRPVVDGPGASARFAAIVSVSADRSGNLYVNDSAAVVRKVAPDGTVSTLAGAMPTSAVPTGAVLPVDGAGSAARFSMLQALSINSAGNLVALDYYQSGPTQELRLRTITPGGIASSQKLPNAGQYGLLAGAGNVLYLAQDAEINILAADGSVMPFVGQAYSAARGEVDGTGDTARFSDALLSIRSDAAGNVYVLDATFVNIHFPFATGNLRKVTPAGVVSTLPGVKGLTVSGYQVARDGTLYVAGSTALSQGPALLGGVVYRISPAGVLDILAGSAVATPASLDGTGTAARFMHPQLKSMDADGNLYLEDGNMSAAGVYNAIYRKVTPAGVATTIARLPDAPETVASDAAGNSYTVDVQRGTIVRTTPAGVASVVAGTPGQNFNYGGALPGYLEAPGNIVRTGPYSFAITSRRTLMWLTVPH